MRHLPAISALTAVAALVGCGAEPLLPNDAPLPDRLSGLPFEDDPDTLPYTPIWPLWSNGLAKRRWVHVPAGKRVDTEDRVWDWPVGSLLFKEFSWEGAPVETRVLRRDDAGWDFATYVWDGDDAVRLEPEARVELEDPEHTVPSRYECRICHEPAGGPIGLRARQLAPDDLEQLNTRFRPDVEHVPIDGHDGPTTEVLGYFVGNCVHCHDGRRSKQTAFDLRPDVALENILGVETESPLLPRGMRVEPGSAENSSLWLALARSDTLDISAMPPAGVQQVDIEAVDLVGDWIDAMDPLPEEPPE